MCAPSRRDVLLGGVGGGGEGEGAGGLPRELPSPVFNPLLLLFLAPFSCAVLIRFCAVSISDTARLQYRYEPFTNTLPHVFRSFMIRLVLEGRQLTSLNMRSSSSGIGPPDE